MSDLNFMDSNFKTEVLQSRIPVVVDFWAPWCGPCNIVSPIIDDLAKELGGKVKIGKLNVDENPKIAGEFGIMSIPTIMVFKNGKPAKSMIGAQSKEQYKKEIEIALGA